MNFHEDKETKGRPNVLKYDIEVPHPSFPTGSQQKEELLVYVDKNNNVISYEMEVESVVCLDTKCEIIPVRLRWDPIGGYESFEIPGKGQQLTKTGHEHFTAEDYKKLHTILGDQRSFLKDLKSEQIVDPEKAQRTVDGVSAPTPLSLQSAVVPGAAYTCYTLWHWINGQVPSLIRGFTEQHSDVNHFVAFFKTGKKEFVEFSIAQLIKRDAFGEEIQEAIRQDIPHNESVVKPALNYFTIASQKTNSSVFYDTIEKVFLKSDKSVRIKILEILMTSELEPSIGFYNRICKFLPDLNSYYEVHLLLHLQKTKNASSEVVTREVIPLLGHENFLIARRAFWFLDEQQLDADQRGKVDAFREKFEDRL